MIRAGEPLLDVIPIWRRDQDGAIITQFDMGVPRDPRAAQDGLPGLRNLTVLDDCLRTSRQRNRGDLVVSEDPASTTGPTYELLPRGDTSACSSSTADRCALLRSMVARTTSRTSPRSALYRAGPMGANAHNDYADRKNGRKPVEPIHPELAEPLAEILGDTYGLIVYQEQVMAIAQKPRATARRRRPAPPGDGQKKKEILDKGTSPSATACEANGYSDASIKTLWDILVPFSDYAFNKAHTAGYGLVSYWTAYLKANYPAEYMAALLQSVKDDKDKSAVYQRVPPDGHRSCRPTSTTDFDYTPRGTDIRFWPRRCATSAATSSRASSTRALPKGRFASFDDFLEKCRSVVNKRVVESLIKAGAFDSLGESRKGLLRPRGAHRLDPRHQAQRAIGQDSLFGGLDDATTPRASHGHRRRSRRGVGQVHAARLRREMLGLYVSDHPLNGVEHTCCRRRRRPDLRRCTATTSATAASITVGSLVTASSARSPNRATSGPSRRWRTSRRRSTSWCSPPPTIRRAARRAPTRCCW